MKEADSKRLKRRYQQPVPEVGNDRRVNEQLDLGIGAVIDLCDTIRDDLSGSDYGIGWWKSYPSLNRQNRILISDQLVSCARDTVTNVIEAYCYRLEFDEAVHDFEQYMKRGIQRNRTRVPAPRNLYDDLSYFRLSANLAGVLRALGSSLDCLAGSIVGVAGLPTDIVRVSMHSATESLQKQSKTVARLQQLHDDLAQCESGAGPTGWMAWLLAMRNTVVHRGRRVVTFNVTRSEYGEPQISLEFPRSPELTEVEEIVYAGGYVASQFGTPADEFLSRLANSMCRYTNSVAALLIELWNERKRSPQLISQPPKQWKDPTKLIDPIPKFSGYDIPAFTGVVRGVAASDEMSTRLHAAALTYQDRDDLRPLPQIWQ
jgi:hypothetical protein